MGKIILVHNSYQCAGGEDLVVNLESRLLGDHKQLAARYIVDNDSIKSFFSKLSVAINVSYSRKYDDQLQSIIDSCEPTIGHIHNFFPMLTPSVYGTFEKEKIPVVQTLHNYRTICPGALLMRDGKICEKCITGSPYQSVLYGCYRNSKVGTFAVARMVDYHRKRNTWNAKVNRFIALTEFAKSKFVKAGFDPDKISVKPNFIPDPLEKGVSLTNRNKQALFVGRISQEKGLRTMLRAWKGLTEKLNIAGEGPLMKNLSACHSEGVTFLGNQNKSQITRLMLDSHFLVMPSEWYEGFPMVLIEAFAHGLPVLASRLGGMVEIVEDGVTGVHFEAGNAEDLAEKAQWMFDHPDECRRMGENARNVYLEKYTPEKNYEMLMKIYEEAVLDKQTN